MARVGSWREIVRLAVTAVSPSYPRDQREMAEKIVAGFDIPHSFIATREMESAAINSSAERLTMLGS